MRYLSFEYPLHEQEYKLLCDALMTKDKGYSTADVRKLNKVLDKLEPIGKAVELVVLNAKTSSYELIKGGVVALEDAEYEFVKLIANDTQWIGYFSRKVESLLDMIENAATELKAAP